MHSWCTVPELRKRRHSSAMFSNWFIAAHNFSIAMINEFRNEEIRHQCTNINSSVVQSSWSGCNDIKPFNSLSFGIYSCYKRILMFHSIELLEKVLKKLIKTIHWTNKLQLLFGFTSMRSGFNNFICYSQCIRLKAVTKRQIKRNNFQLLRTQFKPESI